LALYRSQGHSTGDVLLVDDRTADSRVREVDRHWIHATIISVADDDYSGDVWNLAVDQDETYVADGVVVHNCRSTKVPVLKSWREFGFDFDELPGGTRASMRGEVPAKLDYDGWLRQQPASLQDEILGPGRAKLFRGGLRMERFIDDQNRSLTLVELRDLDARHAA